MKEAHFIYEVILDELYNRNVDAGGCQFVSYHPTHKAALLKYNELRLTEPDDISNAVRKINRIRCSEKLDCSKIDLHFASPEDRTCILSERMKVILPREFDAFRCVSKDDIRPVLTGVHHNNGYKIATDAHVLAIIKSEYPEDLENKTINKKGVCIKGNYPNYRAVIPPIYNCKGITLDANNLREAINMAKESKAPNSLTYIEIATGFDIRVCYAKLLLSFVKTYKKKELYLHIPKDKNGLSCLQVLSGDHIFVLCTSVNKLKDHVIIRNNITTKNT